MIEPLGGVIHQNRAAKLHNINVILICFRILPEVKIKIIVTATNEINKHKS